MTEPADLERLRAAFSQVDEPPHPELCSSPAEIWDGVHGHLSPGRLRDLVEHLAECPACAEAWRLAVMMEKGAGAEPAAGGMPVEGAAVVLGAHRWAWRRYAAVASAAAAAVFAVVLGSQGFFSHGAVSPAAPASPVHPAAVERGGSIEPAAATRWLLTSGEVAVPKSAARLRWSGIAGAVYDLEVDLEDESGAARPVPVVAVRGLAATEYTVPAPELARVPAGGLLHARLTAHLPDGRSETIARDFQVK